MNVLRVYSDLHQEFKTDHYFKITPCGNEKEQVLAIVGDYFHHAFHNRDGVDIFQKDFEDYSQRFKAVVLVLGNHDFYGKKSKLGKDYILRFSDFLSQFPNVHLLTRHTPSVEIDGQVFIGATLWTNFLYKPVESITHGFYTSKSNDFLNITYVHANGKGFSNFQPRHWLSEFISDFNWIKSQVEKNKEKEVVILTHFAPSLQCVDQDDKQGEYAEYYKSDLDKFILNNPHIKTWLFGHIHFQNNLMIGNTHLFSNPVGYELKEDLYPQLSFPEPPVPQKKYKI